MIVMAYIECSCGTVFKRRGPGSANSLNRKFSAGKHKGHFEVRRFTYRK